MKIIKIKDNKDGSVNVTYEFDNKELALLRFSAKIKHKKFDKKFIKDSILKAIEQYIIEMEKWNDYKNEQKTHKRIS